MKCIRIGAAILALSLSFTMTSCFAWVSNTARGLNNKIFGEPDFVDSTVVMVPEYDTVEIPETKIISDTLIDADNVTELTTEEIQLARELVELEGDLEFYYFNDDKCSVVYNEKNAWIFDYELSRVTPVVDLEKMLATADKTGRGSEYFRDVTISYEFSMNSDIQLKIDYTVRSNTADAEYKVYGFYMVHPDSLDRWGREQGSFYGYFLTDITYPGCDEPVTITDLADFAKLGVTEDDYMFDAARAFIENDVETLEEYTGVAKGTLSVWEGVKVTDYTITRLDPTSVWTNTLRIVATIEGSNIERYPDGQYIIMLKDGLGVEFDITSVYDSTVDTLETYNNAERWAYDFASSYGAWYDLDKLTPADPAYSHYLLDYFYYIDRKNGITREFTGEHYKEYCEKYFGYTDLTGNEYAGQGEIRHDGHGGVTMLCDVKTTLAASGIHFIEVTYYADPLRSVVALVRRLVLVEADDGEFLIDRIEDVLTTEYGSFGWSV